MLMLYFENLTFDVIMSCWVGSGQVGSKIWRVELYNFH